MTNKHERAKNEKNAKATSTEKSENNEVSPVKTQSASKSASASTIKSSPLDDGPSKDTTTKVTRSRSTENPEDSKEPLEKTHPSAVGGLPRRREQEHDNTQWENTRFKELHAQLQQGIDPNGPTNVKQGEQASLLVDPKAVGTNVPGESKQQTTEKGEHLKKFPTFSVVLDCVELGCLLFALIMTAIASRMVVLGGYVAMLNILICLGLLGFTLFSQWTCRHVDEELTPEGHRVYATSPLYKKLFFFFHVARMWLSFSSMTILFYHSSCNRIAESLTGAGKAVTQCREPASSSGFYLTAGLVMIPPIVLSVTHLVFICKNQFARKSLR